MHSCKKEGNTDSSELAARSECAGAFRLQPFPFEPLATRTTEVPHSYPSDAFDGTGATMATAGTKRTHSESASVASSPTKRCKVTRKGPRHVQARPDHVELAPPKPAFAQGQLMRSITAALTMTGFDSVTPSALEMFRAATEECSSLSLQLCQVLEQGTMTDLRYIYRHARVLTLHPNVHGHLSPPQPYRFRLRLSACSHAQHTLRVSAITAVQPLLVDPRGHICPVDT